MNLLYAGLSVLASLGWTGLFHTIDRRLKGHSWAQSLATAGVYLLLLSITWLAWELSAYIWMLVPGFLTVLVLGGILWRVVRL